MGVCAGADLSCSLQGLDVCECVRTNQAVTLFVDVSVRVCVGAGSTRVSPFLCQEGHHTGHGQERQVQFPLIRFPFVHVLM